MEHEKIGGKFLQKLMGEVRKLFMHFPLSFCNKFPPQVSDFKLKMHQIRLRLGLCCRPRWGSLQRSPDPLAGFKGPTSKGREGRGWEGKGWEEGGKEGEGKGKGGKREGRGKGDGLALGRN